VHALVGDGSEGKCERIQSLRCQACGRTFSARRDTPLYRLKTASVRAAEVLTALSEGLDIAAAVRVFGHRHATITTWLTRVGTHSATLHQRWFRDLHLPYIQLDEIRTRLRRRAHMLWLWLAIDPITKIIPVLHFGAHPRHSPRGHPRPASATRSWMPPRVHERRIETVFLCADRAFRAVGATLATISLTHTFTPPVKDRVASRLKVFRVAILALAVYDWGGAARFVPVGYGYGQASADHAH
jgi:hypothetical protein